MNRTVFEPEHDEFRGLVQEFLRREVEPHHEDWERAGLVDRGVYRAAAKAGILGFGVPEQYGGLGVDDFRYNAIVVEEQARTGLHGPAFGLHNDIIGPYLLRLTDDAQKARWLPGLASGELTFAIAMTEPEAGSDLAGIRTTARKAGGDWVLNGQKTFISNGINADIVLVVARTDPEAERHRGLSLFAVESGTTGFTRGRKLEKIGNNASDTAELFFSDVRVSAENLIGTEGRGFHHLMENLPSERLSIAVAAIATARSAFDGALAYAKERRAFGSPIGSFQANRFAFAEMDTEIELGQTFVDAGIRAVLDGTFDATTAAKAKWWTTELAKRVVDRCLQMYGGYGYMTEYPIARLYRDVRISTIYGGSTEIMKDLLGRGLGL
ncbi:acyl-CoA dehydrogenase family protein [Amycolatopsis rhabdoformis]|uniref:Acyl-[acyl-carrier-protein] dehydrogenase MbtN n=1 Tax=Amycolatopsis rhabdoformis TaxID=1448059 RepID=A0ABZ1IER7_9PSEU|nr:acyl-CoA dehydrogenase family protein [Amycolatopsis rhabdoformis]WSE32586.1 acyl-CoA dehydrogenase family protein [Amycolatopsis rhabdoformis]